jgi:GNAT superfamily N-acetyltransferase
VEVKEGSPAQAKRIASDLPEHFTIKALERIGSSEGEVLIASEDGEDLGFLVYRIDEEEAEIEWMGVLKNSHRKGIGTLLLRETESIMVKRGIRRIVVRTLDESVGYDPYSGTNAFFRRKGFVKVRTEEVPGWDPGNICAVYKRSLVDSR